MANIWTTFQHETISGATHRWWQHQRKTGNAGLLDEAAAHIERVGADPWVFAGGWRRFMQFADDVDWRCYETMNPQSLYALMGQNQVALEEALEENLMLIFTTPEAGATTDRRDEMKRAEQVLAEFNRRTLHGGLEAHCIARGASASRVYRGDPEDHVHHIGEVWCRFRDGSVVVIDHILGPRVVVEATTDREAVGHTQGTADE